MKGIIVCQPYADQIIHGIKLQEYRTTRTINLNQPLYLLSEGKALGIILFSSIVPSSPSNSYGKYAWNIKVLQKFVTPISYQRKIGQQIWVREVILI